MDADGFERLVNRAVGGIERALGPFGFLLLAVGFLAVAALIVRDGWIR